MAEPKSTKRGFAGLSPEKRAEISRKGGIAAHAPGNHGHEFTSEEAKEAGRKGGRAVSEDRAHMQAIGRKGGRSRGLQLQQAREEEGES